MIDTFSILVSTILCVFVIVRAYRLDKHGLHKAPSSEASEEDKTAEWEAPWNAGG